MIHVHTVQLLCCSQCLAPAMRHTNLKDVLRNGNYKFVNQRTCLLQGNACCKELPAAVESGSMPNRVAVGVPVVKPLGS